MTSVTPKQTAPLVRSISVKNFKCLRDVAVTFSPLTVLIGKNDTGKTSLLEAILKLTASASQRPDFNYFMTKGEHEMRLAMMTSTGELTAGIGDDGKRFVAGDANGLNVVHQPYRLDPAELRKSAKVGVLRELPLPANGASLSAAIDRLPLSRMIRLQEDLQMRIPMFKELLLVSPAEGSKAIEFELIDGSRIPAAQMSDGAMLLTAFLLIMHDEHAPRLIMIEEPENGIHPKQMEHVLRALHSMTQREHPVQIILTTHSPYVLDLVPHESVRVFSRDKDGVRVEDFAALDSVADMLSSGFSLGEAWFNSDEDEIVRNERTR